MPVLVITGTSGFVGGRLVEFFSSRGCRVRALQRKEPEDAVPGVTYFSFELRGPLPEQALAGADAVIHCAYQPHGAKTPDSDAVNLEGTKELLEASRAQGAKFIFLSTLSAHEEARSHYGKSKLEVEGIFDPQRDVVLRLGLVLDPHRGLFSNMVEILKSSRVIPLIGGGRQPVQTIHVEDLCRIIEVAVARQDLCGKFNIGEPEAHEMRDFYAGILRKLGLRRLFVPAPLWMVHAGVTVLERLGIPFGITSENTLGLRHMKAFETREDIAAFGVRLRSYEESLELLISS